MGDKKPMLPGGRGWRWILTGLSLLALCLSLTLSWHYYSGESMVGCGGGSPCDQVLNSRWSSIAGILPVSGLAVGVYLTILIAGFFIGPATERSVRQLAWQVMVVLSGSIAGSAVWYTVLQKWIIGQFCIYCMTMHITGLMLAVLVIWRAFKERENDPGDNAQAPSRRIIQPLHAVGLLLIGLITAGALAAVQLSYTPSVVVHDEALDTALPEIDYNNVPMVGSPDAQHIVTLLFDFQCAHCQKLHFLLNGVVQQYEGKLAFVLCPSPLESSCNPYIPAEKGGFPDSCELTKLGLAVWLADREAFPAFEIWMFTFESGSRWEPRSLAVARAKAAELVGQEALDAALSDPWIQQYLQTSIRIFGQTLQNGKGAVPKMIYKSGWVVPEAYSVDDLIAILQKTLGVPKP